MLHGVFAIFTTPIPWNLIIVLKLRYLHTTEEVNICKLLHLIRIGGLCHLFVIE